MQDHQNKPTSLLAELQAIDKRLDHIEDILRQVAEEKRRLNEAPTDERRN